ncbi:MAG: ABC transporter ATP-binding protein/permease [Candidatus Cloacimonetes bacterium]|nr:ABC transporter ATP-binding protein/permease [Candidatus Cloacimonadota bacterium]
MSNNFEMQQDEILGKMYDSKMFKRLIVYLKPYWIYVIVAFLFLFLNMLADLALPLLVREAVDKHIAPDSRIMVLDEEMFERFKQNADMEKFEVYERRIPMPPNPSRFTGLHIDDNLIIPSRTIEPKTKPLPTTNSTIGPDWFWVVFFIPINNNNQRYIQRDFLSEVREKERISKEKILIFNRSEVDRSILQKMTNPMSNFLISYHNIDENHFYMTMDEIYRLPMGDILALRGKSISALKIIGLLYLIIILTRFLIGFAQNVLTAIASQKAMHDLRSDLFSHLEKMPVSFFDKNPVGRLVTRVTSDIRAIDEMLTSGVITIISDIFIIVAIIILMLILNWQFALVSFTILPFVAFCITIFRKKTRETYREMRKWLAQVNATLAEHLAGVKIIQLFNQYTQKGEKFNESNTQYFSASLRQLKLFAVFRPIIGASRHVATAIILWYAGGQILENLVTIGLFMAFIEYMERLYEPINNFSEKFNILQGAMAGAERIFDLMDQPTADYRDEITNNKLQITNDSNIPIIEFRNVWHTYTDKNIEEADNKNSWVLKDISLKIKQGEKIALVGHTGSGKTSIVNLILNMYQNLKGDILINDANINDFSLHNLREHIGMVQQDVFLFSGNIRENIILNNKNITDDEINKITDYVNVADFINSLPGKLDEPVQERGATFSVGQRQLIAFARVLAYDPAIFILDEATSNIDTETELLIQDALFKIMENRTSIIIAHRLSTIQHCDRIIVMHKGEIAEIGSHQELLKNEGLYYNLYRLQYT